LYSCSETLGVPCGVGWITYILSCWLITTLASSVVSKGLGYGRPHI